jgi:hypothetical protein
MVSYHHCGLAIYIYKKKSILRPKKNYGNSNHFPMKKIIIFPQKTKSSKKEKPKILQDIITLL